MNNFFYKYFFLHYIQKMFIIINGIFFFHELLLYGSLLIFLNILGFMSQLLLYNIWWSVGAFYSNYYKYKIY